MTVQTRRISERDGQRRALDRQRRSVRRGLFEHVVAVKRGESRAENARSPGFRRGCRGGAEQQRAGGRTVEGFPIDEASHTAGVRRVVVAVAAAEQDSPHT